MNQEVRRLKNEIALIEKTISSLERDKEKKINTIQEVCEHSNVKIIDQISFEKDDYFPSHYVYECVICGYQFLKRK